MRIGYVAAVAAMLAAPPALAQVIIGGGDPNAASAHQYNADRDRDAGRANMEASRDAAAHGDYYAAQRYRDAARQDWHAAHHEQYDADRDNSGGVVMQFGR